MKKYIKGILGAIIGGLVFSLPLVFTYLRFKQAVAILSFLIVFGAFMFYKMFGGKLTKKTPIIIAIISLIILTFAVFIVIPMFLIPKDGNYINLSNFNQLYLNNEFVFIMVCFYVVSLIFVISGVLGVKIIVDRDTYSNINIVMDNVSMENLNDEEQINALRELFYKYRAFDKRHSVPDRILLNRIDSSDKYALFNRMKKRGIIASTWGAKSYFNERAITDSKFGKQSYIKYILKTMMLGLLIVSVMSVIFLLPAITSDENSNINTSNNITNDIKPQIYNFKNISITLPETFGVGEEEELYQTFINYGRTGPHKVVLKQIDNSVNSEEREKYKNDYINILSLEQEVKNINSININKLNGYMVYSIHKTYTNEHYYTCLLFGKEGTYFITFYKSIDILENYDSYLEEFTKETNIFLNTIKINDGRL